MHISERQGSAIGLEETNTELTLPPSTVAERGYNTVNGRHTCGVVLPILKERQPRIHCSDSEWSFSTNRISVTRITTAQMTQIEIK